MKTLKIILAILIIGVLSANAQHTFTVNVTCEVKEAGTLYVSLVDKATFEKSGGYLQQKTHKVMSTGKTQTLSFTFENLPQGIYGIRFFLDQNNNGMVDIGTFGSKEPWGMTWINKKPKFSKPKFEQMCWEITSDFTFAKVLVES